ncbi:MAG TPA: class I SAM-dependent methyltransferase [Candidatus Omnitrophota bacterium]|nr:class I SAM-dependent methyltransferase [Candidatus Omnitrophota bacterium]HPS37051.1 class I SAM-dependent methyltransferase [Candidatus Omnitrophota bacterium]
MTSIKKDLQAFLRRVLDGLVRHCFCGSLEKRAEGIAQLFEKQIPPKSRILDLGGGWGFYAAPMKKRGHEHLVVDVVKPGYQQAPVVIYDGGRIPFPDKSFDVTLLVTMLHHVPDPEALFREVRRVTRDKVIVVEDLYHHKLGRFWTIFRDRMLNLEWLDHPHQFRKHEEWLGFFERQELEAVTFSPFYTWLAGFRILNGLYVLKVR